MLAIRVHSSRNYRLSPESSEYTFTSVYKDTNPDIVQCIYTHSSVLLLSCAQLFAMVWTVALQAPLSMGFFRQEYWSGLPFPTPGDLPDAGIEPTSLVSPALAGRFFTNCAIWQNAPGKMQYSIFFADLASRYLFCLNSCSSHK